MPANLPTKPWTSVPAGAHLPQTDDVRVAQLHVIDDFALHVLVHMLRWGEWGPSPLVRGCLDTLPPRNGGHLCRTAPIGRPSPQSSRSQRTHLWASFNKLQGDILPCLSVSGVDDGAIGPLAQVANLCGGNRRTSRQGPARLDSQSSVGSMPNLRRNAWEHTHAAKPWRNGGVLRAACPCWSLHLGPWPP